VESPGPELALEWRDIRAGYDGVDALRGVSLKVPASGVVALLGRNGAGKTTALRVASGRLKSSSGTMLMGGADIGRQSAHQRSRRGLCLVPEGRAIFPNLTVAENLRMWTFRGKVSRADVQETAYTRFPILAQRRTQLAGTLSGGEQQMLAMSRALTTNPQVLLLDEISMGLAPRIVASLYEVVGEIAANGPAVVVVEQFVQTVLKVADRAAVMTSGRIEIEGTPSEIAPAIADIYLGVGKR
jgi:branched-chain amino acid transport system ATP-binding protein